MFPLKSSLKQTKQASKQTTTTRNPEQQQPKKTNGNLLPGASILLKHL